MHFYLFSKLINTFVRVVGLASDISSDIRCIIMILCPIFISIYSLYISILFPLQFFFITILFFKSAGAQK